MDARYLERFHKVATDDFLTCCETSRLANGKGSYDCYTATISAYGFRCDVSAGLCVSLLDIELTVPSHLVSFILQKLVFIEGLAIGPHLCYGQD